MDIDKFVMLCRMVFDELFDDGYDPFGNIELKDIELHEWVAHLHFRDCDEDGSLILRDLDLYWRENTDRICIWMDRYFVEYVVLYLDSIKHLSEHVVSLVVYGAKRDSQA
nr:MAG TPA: hypothetical protein [Caudoviricetes sp.]